MVERTPEIKQVTIDFYNRFCYQYWERHPNAPVKSMEKFAKMLRGPNILDLGCGGGHSAVFKMMGIKLGLGMHLNPIAADISPIMCLAAKQKGGLPAVVMDQENLCFKPNSFDGAWLSKSLLHSPSEVVPGILADLRLILKPRGVLFLGMQASIGQYIETELKTTEIGTRYYCYWPTYRLHGLLETLGFAVEELSIHGKDSLNKRNYFEIFAVKE
ncbi:MAG: class I SAM-dependent methyltransferase [bacterium]|nr:class I SAM-dependent methyltransferase [bacterium]